MNAAFNHKSPRMGYRWIVCALLFLATTCNYIDRQILGILAPELQRELGWSEVEYGHIVTSFQAAYALGLLFFGWLIDRIGTKWGLAIAVFFWSCAAMLHGQARSALQFAAMRFALGLSEAGNFPAAIKAVAEWFPQRERALATGIFNSGTNLGAIIAPLCVPWIAFNYGWPAAFYITGAIGFFWLLLWYRLFHLPEKCRALSTKELALIQSDRAAPAKKRSWRSVLGYRQTWGFAVAKFMTDPIWWFYLYWTPKYLNSHHGISLLQLGAPLITIYLVADFGSIGGGWLSSRLIASGRSASYARKLTMLLCALMVLPVTLTSQTDSLWLSTLLISLAAAAHQAWSANLFSTVTDIFPKEAVASVVGVGGMAGAIGGMCIATLTGYLLEWTGSYVLLFSICGSAYLLALLLLHVIVGPITPITE